MARPDPDNANDLPAAAAVHDVLGNARQNHMRTVAQHSDMLRSAVDWLWETDTQLDLTFVSSSIAAATEVPAQLLIGCNLFAVLGLQDGDPALDRLSDAVAERRPFRDRVFVTGPECSTSRPYRITGVPFYHPISGRLAGYRGTGSVLPESAASPDEDNTADQLLEMLEAALARKDQLEWESSKAGNLAFQSRLASVAHELRTPLNAIMGFAQVIKDRHLGDDPAHYQDYARNIHESGLHLLEVINGLLDMARIDAGVKSPDSEELDVVEIAAGVLRMLEDRAEEAKVVLLNDIAGDEPRIKAERRAVRQILINLLTNAIKYTPPGGAAGIESRSDGETCLALTVWDTGVGIAPEDQERVFEPSYRVEHNGLERPGNGLGLAISRDLARAMGGDITVASRPGEGSRLTLWLPLAETPQTTTGRAGQDPA